jgi:hypothetical protein
MEHEAIRKVLDLCSCSVPVFVDRQPAERAAALARKHSTVNARGSEPGQVLFEGLDHERRERNRADTRRCFRRAADDCAVAEFLLLLLDRKRPVQQVYVPSFEPEELALAEAYEAGEYDKASIPAGHRVRELPYLRNSRNGPFRSALDTRPIDLARIPHNPFVGDRGREDGSQQPVALCDRRSTELLTELRVPSPNGVGRDAVEGHVFEDGSDVPKLRPIGLSCTRPQIGLRIEPVVCVLAE